MTVALAAVSLFFYACEDNVSEIGDSISNTEVSIRIDSLTFKLDAVSIDAPLLASRTGYSLLGSIKVPEYGNLECSYVTQFLPAETLNIPDTITSADVDSVKMFLTIPKNYVTGDTLAPQQLKIYSLTKELPNDINSGFNPADYYDASSPIAVKNYTLSGFTFNDSTFSGVSTIELKANLPVELGRKVFDAYASNPDIFIWPQEFAKYWPGVYVAPTFGKGCLAPVQKTTIFAYFPQTKAVREEDEEGNDIIKEVQVADSVCLFTTAPEVISNVNISYAPSDILIDMVTDGKSIITTPGGYAVKFKFPAKEILKDFWNQESHLGVINNMTFSIPAKAISNSYGIGIPPSLLMIKASELETFFAEGKLPDNKTSFTSVYSTDKASYSFNTMRQYIVDLIAKGEYGISDDDLELILVPVTVTTEEYTDGSTGQLVTSVTSVTPYIIMPTMVDLDTENALVVFTYSNQMLD